MIRKEMVVVDVHTTMWNGNTSDRCMLVDRNETAVSLEIPGFFKLQLGNAEFSELAALFAEWASELRR